MSKTRYRKDVSELLEKAEALGFVDVEWRRSGHLRLRHPNGSVTISGTPSCPFARRKGLADLRRVASGRYARA